MYLFHEFTRIVALRQSVTFLIDSLFKIRDDRLGMLGVVLQPRELDYNQGPDGSDWTLNCKFPNHNLS